MTANSVLKCLAPAKLNLFLHITGQRADGYHQLQTAFQFLDYCDELHFTLRKDTSINLLTPIDGVPDEDNLIIKAASILQKHPHYLDLPQGVDISITKRLPMGGGLGGGSSNAATTLLALNQLWQLNISNVELQKLGLELGADVPVFIHGEACIAEGVGEHFTPAEPDQCWYLVIVPDCQVNTGEIFSNSSLTRNSKTLRIRAPLNRGVLEKLRNDCESVVRELYPEVNQALIWLSRFGLARMTGTGCCVFCSFDSEDQANEVAKLYRSDKFHDNFNENNRTFVAKAVNVSPVRRSLG